MVVIDPGTDLIKINFFLEISDAYSGHHSDYYPKWMLKPRSSIIRGLIKDSLGLTGVSELSRNGIEYEDLDKNASKDPIFM